MTIKEIKISKQIWMTENLSIGTFANGDSNPEAETEELWPILEVFEVKIDDIQTFNIAEPTSAPPPHKT